MLEETTDQAVQEYIKLLHSNGRTVNTCIVMAAAEAIISTRHPGHLQGGSFAVTKTWAKSLLIKMNFVKRKSSNAGKLLPVEFNLLKKRFLNDISAEVIMNDIPEDLIFNWDQTSIHLVPVSEWTMEKQGTKNIIVTGVDDKRQITLVLVATMTGCFLYPQVLYEGKTARCHPSVKFPDGWDVSHTANHWSNDRSMIGYLEKIVIPFLKAKHEKLGLPASQPALAIFDVFKGQQTDNFKQTLQSNNIRFVAVPANCTDKLQPMDLAINKPLKDAMK